MKKYLLLSLFISLSSFANTNVIEQTAQRFHPVVTQHGMVSSQQYLATQVGVDILKQGGNAIDAAVATAFALAVTLPRAGNIAGGGFMLIHLNSPNKTIAINYREQAPLKANSTMLLDEKGNYDRQKATASYLSTATPGTVYGMCYALEKYGTMSLSQVMAPAIKLAQDGFVVDYYLAESLKKAQTRLMRSADGRKIFFNKQGQTLQMGEKLIQKDLANTLSLIARDGKQAFYEGGIAHKIAQDMLKNHGLISLEDLKNYSIQELEPTYGSFHGYKIYSMPPPSSGGIILIEILNILENFDLKSLGLNSAQSIHLITEAMNLAFNDRNYYLGDPDFVSMPIARLLSKKYAKKLARQINLKAHTPAQQISHIVPNSHESKQTTHFSVVDKDGNMVSNTYTLNYTYGNGYIVPGTGFLLNNEMDDFSAKSGVANSFGLVQSEKNSIQAQKRPLSSMTPVIILNKNNQALLATGAPGGSMIITSVSQFILNYLVFDLNISSATMTPRIHSQLWPDRITIEQGLSPDTIKLLEKMGHKVILSNAMASLQTVANQDEYFYGAADSRRPGALASGY